MFHCHSTSYVPLPFSNLCFIALQHPVFHCPSTPWVSLPFNNLCSIALQQPTYVPLPSATYVPLPFNNLCWIALQQPMFHCPLTTYVPLPFNNLCSIVLQQSMFHCSSTTYVPLPLVNLCFIALQQPMFHWYHILLFFICKADYLLSANLNIVCNKCDSISLLLNSIACALMFLQGKKFHTKADIPPEFFRRNIKLRGRVMQRSSDTNILYLDHKPAVSFIPVSFSKASQKGTCQRLSKISWHAFCPCKTLLYYFQLIIIEL